MASVVTRFPPWLRKRLPREGADRPVRDVLRALRLNTVCQSAHCPNQCECFAEGTATFMILGSVCTRACRFCAVGSGVPAAVEPDEPRRVARAAAALGLRHVVVTSVTRDDLPDGGSAHFAATIEALRDACDATVEVLTPDFQGRESDIRRVIAARPDVFNHNVETVPRLYPVVRPQAVYRRSLDLLRLVASEGGGMAAKSGLMLGLGETRDEVLAVLRDLRDAGCRALTLGQYLRPSPAHLAVERFVPPEEFDTYRQEAQALGFEGVAAGPFVRSSYHAEAMARGLAQQGRS